jgi:hypothetical protein
MQHLKMDSFHLQRRSMDIKMAADEDYVHVVVDVTKEDIAGGLPGSVEFCPINLALERVIKHPTTAHRRYFTTLGVRYNLPGEATDFTLDFDFKPLRSSLRPFKFIVRVPQSIVKEDS